MTGALGLNTVPSARMDDPGTIRFGLATLDPYAHSFLGVQIAEPLYISLRQTARISDPKEEAERLFPGVDLKVRLIEESRSRPEISVGLQSALGHKRMAGEYIAASKRFYDFDFTAGLGWGRFGSAGHFDNPLKSLHKHFGKSRPLDGEMPNGAEDWFTGEKIGIFAGLEYNTPVEGLSLKLEWGADRYSAEQAAFDYSAGDPWSAGLSYAPYQGISAALAVQGLDKVMARLSLQGPLSGWPDPDAKHRRTTPMRPYRTGLGLPAQMELSAQKDDIALHNARLLSLHTAAADLVLKPGSGTPAQLSDAAVHMANHAGPAVEELRLTPRIMGLRGPSVHLQRTGLEKAVARHLGSAEEIWRSTQFDETSSEGLLHRERREAGFLGARQFSFTLQNKLSLSEEDSGVLYRTSILAGWRGPQFFGLLDTGQRWRLNLGDNLDRLEDLRLPALLPVRSNEPQFAARSLSVDTLWSSYTNSFTPEVHLALTAGYLEEMYAGLGGEIVYRPFEGRLSAGAELWQVFKRDPLTALNLGLNGDSLLSGHVNIWYDLPLWDTTLKASAGRYLAEDLGGSLHLIKTFKNGAELEGYVTLTDQADFDLFGGTTHAAHGLRLKLPLGGLDHRLQSSSLDTQIKTLGRDAGQRLEKPFDLYETTRPFSKAHMIRNWGDITP